MTSNVRKSCSVRTPPEPIVPLNALDDELADVADGVVVVGVPTEAFNTDDIVIQVSSLQGKSFHSDRL